MHAHKLLLIEFAFYYLTGSVVMCFDEGLPLIIESLKLFVSCMDLHLVLGMSGQQRLRSLHIIWEVVYHQLT